MFTTFPQVFMSQNPTFSYIYLFPSSEALGTVFLHMCNTIQKQQSFLKAEVASKKKRLKCVHDCPCVLYVPYSSGGLAVWLLSRHLQRDAFSYSAGISSCRCHWTWALELLFEARRVPTQAEKPWSHRPQGFSELMWTFHHQTDGNVVECSWM